MEMNLDDIICTRPHYIGLPVTIKIKRRHSGWFLSSRACECLQSKRKLHFPLRPISHYSEDRHFPAALSTAMIYSCSEFAIKMMNGFSLLIIKSEPKLRCFGCNLSESERSLLEHRQVPSDECLKWQFIRRKQKLLRRERRHDEVIFSSWHHSYGSAINQSTLRKN